MRPEQWGKFLARSTDENVRTLKFSYTCISDDPYVRIQTLLFLISLIKDGTHQSARQKSDRSDHTFFCLILGIVCEHVETSTLRAHITNEQVRTYHLDMIQTCLNLEFDPSSG